jgi:hypothetical protein
MRKVFSWKMIQKYKSADIRFHSKIIASIALMLLLFMMLPLRFDIQPVEAEPRTIIVPDDYPTIQAAINAANANDTIFVRNGTYYEHVVVNKTVYLKGENRDGVIIDGNGTGIVVYIKTAQSVTVCSFTIENGYFSNIAIESSIYVSVTYNKIINSNGHGIDLNASASVTIANNEIVNRLINTTDGIFLSNHMGSYGNSIIRNNKIVNNVYGIRIYTVSPDVAESATIVGNNITNNTYAVYHSRQMGSVCLPHNFYHNNFVNNTNNNITFKGAAVAHNWDDGYPSGGNYWSNYNGTDVHSGPESNQTGPGWDGIGDAAYSVGQNNSDNYPSMNPWPLAHLQVHTFATEQGEMEDVSVWVNETVPCQNSTAYFLLKYGTYTVKVQSSFGRQDPSDPTKHCHYTFDHWENGSNQNPRTIRLTTDRVLTAYYKVWVHLRVHTFATGQGEIEGVKVWVNVTEQPQYSPADFLLELGIYTVKVETSFTRQDPQDPTRYYRYYFDHWEDGSKQNPRTITLTAERVLTAYYMVQVMYVEAPPRG